MTRWKALFFNYREEVSNACLEDLPFYGSQRRHVEQANSKDLKHHYWSFSRNAKRRGVQFSWYLNLSLLGCLSNDVFSVIEKKNYCWSSMFYVIWMWEQRTCSAELWSDWAAMSCSNSDTSRRQCSLTRRESSLITVTCFVTVPDILRNCG